MDERSKKAFDFAADLTKQLITLSTGIVTLTLLLSKDLVGPRMIAVAAWSFFLLSTIFGLWTLMGLTGTLAPAVKAKQPSKSSGAPKKADDQSGDEGPLLIGKNVRYPSGLQIATFGIATLLTLVYVLGAFARPPIPAPRGVTCSCWSDTSCSQPSTE